MSSSVISEASASSDRHLRIGFDESELEALTTTAHQAGFSSVSAWLQHVALSQLESPEPGTIKHLYPAPELFHETGFGEMYHGDSLGLLHGVLKPDSVDLIMTSPPFGLVRKKDYGNEDSGAYCDWFRPFAEGFHRVLKDDGSLVIDIGGAWNKGEPTRSLYHFELLMMLCKEYGFHLCQEHYWWNPSKLPSPAEWVNIRRVRVKDAVNCVWWLSKTPWPKANNRRVLAPYSPSMKRLQKKGYKAKLRPSGHDISEKFGKDNGGSVPPNLLAIANTKSNGQYEKWCKENGIKAHPARFPATLPEYFIRFLTERNDLVVDPFGGSCVTGAVAENLERRWVTSELNLDYLEGAKGRFMGGASNGVAMAKRAKTDEFNWGKSGDAYAVAPPCTADCGDEPLVADGGRSRKR